MSIIYMDGFDGYADNANTACENGNRVIDATTGYGSGIRSTEGRWGGGCYSFIRNGIYQTAEWSARDELYLGFALYPRNWTGTVSDYEWIDFRQSTAPGTVAVQVKMDAQKPILYVNNVAKSTGLWMAGSAAQTGDTHGGGWRWIEVYLKLSTGSTVGRYILRSNGVQIDTWTGNTAAGATGVTNVRLKGWYDGVTSEAFKIDDLVVWEPTGDPPSTWLSDFRIRTFLPDDDSTALDWTASAGSSHHLLVDDPTGHDGDTTYVYSTSTGDVDRYGTAGSTLVSTALDIYAVAAIAVARGLTTGEPMTLGVVSSTGAVSNTTLGDLSTAYGVWGGSIATNPTWSTAPWSKALLPDEVQVVIP